MPKTKTEQKKEVPTLGEKIKFYRQRLNISQIQLENNSGLSVGMVSRIENNRVFPSVTSLWKIAVALNLNSIETAYLFKINLYGHKRRDSSE